MKKFLNLVGIIVVLLAVCLFIPWEHVNWGKISVLPASTITVTGEAKQEEAPQIAHFSVSVTVTDVDKQIAVNQVNTQMTTIIKILKDFDIEAKDIQTQQLSVYQTKAERLPAEEVWQANNSISITLRDINQTSALTDLLQASDATHVSGPNYSLDDTIQAQAELLSKAVDNARDKAEKIALASKRKLGKIITVTEGGTSLPVPIFRSMSAAESMPTPVEPGTETIHKSVTVTFELK
ncbi:MAG: SIMPL domain-containing protein [Patescibacteria group bacterium]|nr:SIMPL domain-containing protein [Patescibacteria group bacterium]